MSLGYFPRFYEDELIYSLLSRYYAHSGMLCYRNAAENLFVFKSQKPDIEFINNTDFIAWYFGHFHEDTVIKNKFICLYEDVIML